MPNRNSASLAKSSATLAQPLNLKNSLPVDLRDEGNRIWASNLQGNILSGHGRDHTVNIFLKLPADQAAGAAIAKIAPLVTSARQQAEEQEQYRRYKIPGRLFVGFLLTAQGYRTLGHSEADLAAAFTEAPNSVRQEQSTFLDGMAKHAEADLGDPPESEWDEGFRDGKIDAMLLLADDDESFLKRAARGFINVMIEAGCELRTVEVGEALRTDGGEGIEHFGYVDGRSQPLFLKTDFQTKDGRPGFATAPDGTVDRTATLEALEPGKSGGRIDVWDPFEPLERVLIADALAGRADCLGSYFVFRKLEQNVRDFMIAEQKLADAMNLVSTERHRAGAMAVGRFRDGTPLVLSSTDGLLPPKDNNFRYDDLSGSTADKAALRCPLQAHIRKTNPRGDVAQQLLGAKTDEVAAERRRRIARRGIAYGKRNRKPNTFQALDDLPSDGVGLLFMCFQASIRGQFAFLQRSWANNNTFARQGGGVGLDPLIGQLDQDHGVKTTGIPQQWEPSWGKAGNPASFSFSGFVKMKGGEFFFAPSIPYLKNFATTHAPEPRLAAFAGLPVTSD